MDILANEPSTAVGPSGCTSIELKTVWNVQADSSYRVDRKPPQPKNLIAVRTTRGRGRIELADMPPFNVPAPTLFILENQRLRKYSCDGPKWNFWWFYFTVSGPLHFPLHTVMEIPAHRLDTSDFSDVFTCLRRERFAQRARASATFSMMLYRWLSSWQGHRNRRPHQNAIESIIDSMHHRLAAQWRVSAMAKEAGMSERLFRQEFRNITGQSPKHFYDGLRLQMAFELLRLGINTIAEIADRLGFYSPFHLSRAFKRKFGVPPSHVCR